MSWFKEIISKNKSDSGYSVNIEEKSIKNTYFRKVLFTGPNSQLVIMSLNPNEDIGMEVHENIDQFIRVERGKAKAILDGKEHILSAGSAVIIPSGTRHNIINASKSESLKLYTIYSPPHHPDGTIHKTKDEAEVSE